MQAMHKMYKSLVKMREMHGLRMQMHKVAQNARKCINLLKMHAIHAKA
jgi:hypothetical protein